MLTMTGPGLVMYRFLHAEAKHASWNGLAGVGFGKQVSH